VHPVVVVVDVSLPEWPFIRLWKRIPTVFVWMRKATYTILAATIDGSAFIVEPLDQSLMHTPSEHAVKKHNR